MRAREHSSFAAALVAAALAGKVCASWSDDPAQNLAVADRTGDQVQVKIAPTADGGAYVSWFDNNAGGYDVYLQRLDAAGNEQWAHNGVLVADRSFSSTQDYDLDVDTDGFALITFRDDRFGGVEITANRVSPAGVLEWGMNGVQLTSGAGFVAAPKIAGTNEGYAVVAWREDNDVKVQKLDMSGAEQWAPVITIVDPMGSSLSASDLDASDLDNVVIALVRGFLGATLYAQKLDQNGAPLWGAEPLAIFDGGTLQTGNFPQMVPDGSGGAVFGWYGTGPLQCYAQRVDSAGVEQWAHDGVPASTEATRIRVSPSVDYDPATGSTYLFWTEENALQSEFGVYGQRFDSDGARQWTDSGRAVVAIDGVEKTQVNTVQVGSDVVVAWSETVAFGNQRLRAARLDTAGHFVWAGDIVDFCTVASSKSRLFATRSSAGVVFAAWGDGRSDGGDIYAQNINADGSLGAATCPADFTGPGGAGMPDGNVDALDFLLLIGQWGSPCVGSCEADITGPTPLVADGNVDALDYLLLIAQWGNPGNCATP